LYCFARFEPRCRSVFFASGPDATDHVTVVFSTESSLSGYATLTDITGLVTAFSISDGVNTLTDANAWAIVRVQTSSSGDILNWLFSAIEPKVASLGTPSTLITTRNLVSDVFDAGVMGPCGQVAGNLCVGVITQERGTTSERSGGLDASARAVSPPAPDHWPCRFGNVGAKKDGLKSLGS
jgi:hypothetical protein